MLLPFLLAAAFAPKAAFADNGLVTFRMSTGNHSKIRIWCNGTSGAVDDAELQSADWSHNGAPTPPEWMENTGLTSSLSVDDAGQSDLGKYECSLTLRATDGIPTIFNCSIVVVSEPMVDKHLARAEKMKVDKDEDSGEWVQGSVTVTDGYDAELTCLVIGEPVPTISWFRDARPIELPSASLSSSGTNNRTLRIVSADFDHAGDYSCVANNTHGSLRMRILLRVKSRLAPLWPSLTIFVEIVLLGAIIGIFEWRKKRAGDAEHSAEPVPDDDD